MPPHPTARSTGITLFCSGFCVSSSAGRSPLAAPSSHCSTPAWTKPSPHVACCSRGAGVGVVLVAVVALLALLDDAVAAVGERAGVGAGVAVSIVAVVALLDAGAHEAVAARASLQPLRHASVFESLPSSHCSPCSTTRSPHDERGASLRIRGRKARSSAAPDEHRRHRKPSGEGSRFARRSRFARFHSARHTIAVPPSHGRLNLDCRADLHGNLQRRNGGTLASFSCIPSVRGGRSFRKQQAVGFTAHLSREVNERTGEPLSKATLLATLNALKAFFTWLSQQNGFRSKFTYLDAEYFALSLKDTAIAKTTRGRPVPSIEQIRHVTLSMPSGNVSKIAAN